MTKTTQEKVYVSEPSMPDFDEFSTMLRDIWRSKYITNCGQFHERLEKELGDYLRVPYVSLTANATIGLSIAIKALDLTGEVITTPYSFIATAHVIKNEKLQPVFCDIENDGFNIDPNKIEALITERTSAIMPVHCYGYPCDVEKIQAIADRHGLKVIYDAAHAFGIDYKGSSVLRHGELSVLSFHATKVYTTIEGGAIISPDLETKTRIDRIRNFGIENEVSIPIIGMNGKMNEFQAAFGLAQLARIDELIAKRRHLAELYQQRLSHSPLLDVKLKSGDFTRNYSYFPVMVKGNAAQRDAIYDFLKSHNILARRYFYPLLSDVSCYTDLPSASPLSLPNAHHVSDRILCLPLHPNLTAEQVYRICDIIDSIPVISQEVE